VPRNLRRYYGAGHIHFITFSCYRRLPWLSLMGRRDQFLRALEKVRRSYELVVIGNVVMPEHVHLLVSEPRKADLSVAIKALTGLTPRRATLVWGTRTRQEEGHPDRLVTKVTKKVSNFRSGFDRPFRLHLGNLVLLTGRRHSGYRAASKCLGATKVNPC
jgi:REP element-mobilizing transposase RayT